MPKLYLVPLRGKTSQSFRIILIYDNLRRYDPFMMQQQSLALLPLKAPSQRFGCIFKRRQQRAGLEHRRSHESFCSFEQHACSARELISFPGCQRQLQSHQPAEAAQNSRSPGCQQTCVRCRDIKRHRGWTTHIHTHTEVKDRAVRTHRKDLTSRPRFRIWSIM